MKVVVVVSRKLFKDAFYAKEAPANIKKFNTPLKLDQFVKFT